jgi:beta-lactamase class A
MAISRTTHPLRTRIAVLTAASALALAFSPVQARADSGTTGDLGAYCSSPSHPELAARLSHDIADALAGRRSTLAFTVRDAGTGLVCSSAPTRHFDSASIVKATIMGAVLRLAQDEHRSLTSFEEENLGSMITQSDNDAAVRLWNHVGQARLQAFLDLAGMHDTVLAPDGAFGLTQVTAGDEMKQLDVYTTDPDVLSPEHKAYGLRLMAEVEAGQRWGTPYGAPPEVTVQVKNGWLQRATHSWRVNSLGIFTAPTRTYQMAVLTDDDPTLAYGIDTVQRIAWQVHHDLAACADQGLGAQQPHTADAAAAVPTL